MSVISIGPRVFPGVVRLSSAAPPVDPLLNRTIVISDPTVKGYLQPFLDRDILPTLAQMTGVSYSVVSSSLLRGVVRVGKASGYVHQEYSLTGALNSDLLVTAGTWMGLKHALYFWLKRLGVKQLLPDAAGEWWRTVPSRSDVRLALSERKTPAATTMQWGTTGAPSDNTWPFDIAHVVPQQDAWHAWLDWNCRPIGSYSGSQYVAPGVGSQYDPGAYNAKMAEFNALGDLAFGQKEVSWKQSTHYKLNDRRTANDKLYVVTAVTTGISASSGTGPSGTGAGITDGGVSWDWTGNGARTLLNANFHLTHEGHEYNANPLSPVASDYTGTTGVVGVYSDHLKDQAAHEVSIFDPINEGMVFGLNASLADGGFGCQDDKCLNLHRGLHGLSVDSTSTDRSLWCHGRIADIVKASYPDLNLCVYDFGYDLQSPPPTPGWPISPLLNIMVANYVFSSDVYAPRVSYEQWHDSAVANGYKTSIYDFWALPQFVASDFNFNTYQAWERMRHWVTVGVDAIATETTSSTGAVGLHWAGALDLCWNPTRTNEEMMDDFCTDAFGAAAPAMKIMLMRWWGKGWPRQVAHDYELALSFDDMARADALVVSDPVARHRVAAFQHYVTFLSWNAKARNAGYDCIAATQWATGTTYGTVGQVVRTGTTIIKCYRLKTAGVSAGSGTGPSGTGSTITDNTCVWEFFRDLEPIIQELLYQIWRGALTFMVDNKWTHDAWVYNGGNPNIGTTLKDKWTIPDLVGSWAAWRTTNGITSQFTDDEIRTRFTTAKAGYTLPGRDFTTDPIITKLVAPFTPTGSSTPLCIGVQGIESPTPDGAEFIFYRKPSATGIVRFALDSLSNTDTCWIRVTLQNAETGVNLQRFTRHLPSEVAGQVQDFDLGTLATGFYRVLLENEKSGFAYTPVIRTDTPIVRVGAYDRICWGPSDTGYPRYFFVPKGKTKFFFFGSDDAVGANYAWYDSTGTPATFARYSPHVWQITVPAGQDQKVWLMWGNPFILDGTGGTPRFIDIPEWTSPSKEQMIIPFNLYTE